MLTPIQRVVVDLVPVGLWLVSFDVVWDIETDENDQEISERIAEVSYSVREVTRDAYIDLPEDVIGKDLSMNDTDGRLGLGDTHDFRPRLFATKDAAEEHGQYTVKRFQNPQPWECFVKL